MDSTKERFPFRSAFTTDVSPEDLVFYSIKNQLEAKIHFASTVTLRKKRPHKDKLEVKKINIRNLSLSQEQCVDSITEIATTNTIPVDHFLYL